LAVGGKNAIDLDLKLSMGTRVVANDQGAVNKSVAKFCAKKDATVKMRVQMFKGKGAFAYGVFAKGNADLQSNFQLEEAARLIVKKLQSKVASNMQPIGEMFSGYLGHRNAANIPVVLDSARCFKFIAAGGSGVQDLSMSVLVDKKIVASDKISGNSPIVQWCSPQRVHANVKLTMYGGFGAYAMQVFGENKPTLTAPEKVGGDQSDFIANRIRQLHAQYGKGRATISKAFRGNLSANNEKIFKVKLTAGHCYTIIGAGNPSVKNLDIVLLDHNNRELQKDKTRNSYPVLDTNPCPSFSGIFTLRAKMINGFGQFGVQVFSD